MKKITIGILVFLMLVATSFPAFAKTATKHLNNDFVSNQKITNNLILNSSKKSVIKSGTTITLEEGCTLTVYGHFVVDGTFVNKGTVKIISSTKAGSIPGLMENHGTIHNLGIMEVSNAHYRNGAGGVFSNKGQINLAGDKEKIILFSNLAPTSFDGVKKPSRFLNEGTVFINNTKGWGFYNTGVVENKGTIKKGEQGTFYGIELGQPEEQQIKPIPIFPEESKVPVLPVPEKPIAPVTPPVPQPEPEIQPPVVKEGPEVSIEEFLKNGGITSF